MAKTKSKQRWEWYKNGVSYNNGIEPNYYDMVDCNWDFKDGRQWRGANLDNELPQPVFNNIDRFVTFFVASIMSSKPKGVYSSPVTTDDNSDDVINASWDEFVERVKLVQKTKRALVDGAVTGDYIGHMVMDVNAKPYGGAFSNVEGQIDFELIDPVNFYMGNANTNDVQSQPYIQIAGRDLVKNLKAENESQMEIQADNDVGEQIGEFGKIEMEGKDSEKATYVITYQKVRQKDGSFTVMASKDVAEGAIYENVDMGIDLYPAALGNWEEQRNTWHGKSFVTAAIPAQIYINRAFAMAMFNTMTTAFPKFLYDKNKIAGITNKVAGQIGVDLAPGESIGSVATYLAPGNMSAQVPQIIEMAQTYLQETIGANDALLGNVNPEQASGVSISVSSKQSGIPLENPKMNMYNWYEDLMRIYYSMVSNLYGVRPVVVNDGDTSDIIEFDFSTLNDTYKSVKVDVGASGYWTEIAVVQMLDNLLDRGLIEFIDYLERMPDGYIKNKQGLIDKIKEQMQPEQPEQVEVSDEEIIAQLTPEQQQAFIALPPEQQQALIQEYKVGGAI